MTKYVCDALSASSRYAPLNPQIATSIVPATCDLSSRRSMNTDDDLPGYVRCGYILAIVRERVDSPDELLDEACDVGFNTSRVNDTGQVCDAWAGSAETAVPCNSFPILYPCSYIILIF